MTPDFSNAVWRKSSRSGSSGGACIEVAFAPDTAVWQKSSKSSSSGGQCVEVAFVRDSAVWRKSTRSQGNGGQCVEVAVQPQVVGVRDSKDVDGPILVFGQRAFRDFLRSVTH